MKSFPKRTLLSPWPVLVCMRGVAELILLTEMFFLRKLKVVQFIQSYKIANKTGKRENVVGVPIIYRVEPILFSFFIIITTCKMACVILGNISVNKNFYLY